MMRYFDVTIRIPYADVDQMGVVYYANYLVYFERGRTEFLRKIGLDYRRMEKDLSLFLPVKEVHLEYVAPVHYDDLIVIRTCIEKLGRASINFTYAIFREHKEEKILITGYTNHVFINKEWKPSRIPVKVAQKIMPHVKP
ncbi:MAG: thioesterase family protein [bacterium]